VVQSGPKPAGRYGLRPGAGGGGHRGLRGPREDLAGADGRGAGLLRHGIPALFITAVQRQRPILPLREGTRLKGLLLYHQV